ncbi:MAG: IclR family transcriptional regulator [Halanaeroarchaeum sp.]
MTTENVGEPRTVDAVQTACAVLDALQTLDGAGVTELATYIDVSKATAYNHLTTLRSEEYVVKEGDQYLLSLKYLDVAEYVRDRLGIYEVVEDELQSLAAKTDEVAQFATVEHGQTVYLHKERGENAVETASSAGKRELLHCTSLGKAMLAHMPEERVRDIVDQHGLPARTEHTITEYDALLGELETVRERGYAFDEEELITGLRCVAAPIRDSEGAVIGAVSISGPSSRMTGERYREELPAEVQRSANVIEINTKFA